MRVRITRGSRYRVPFRELLALGCVALAICLVFLGGQTPIASAHHVPFARGDVFAGVSAGVVKHFNSSGVLLESLNTTSNSNEETGMCFDGAGNLYTTNFTAGNMAKFNGLGALLQYPWGTVGFSTYPSSCVLDSSNNIYVGEVDGSNRIIKMSTAGNLLGTYSPATGPRGMNWIDLASDQCTIYYTSEGQAIKRFNVCTNSQQSDFATGLAGTCYALRIRSNGEVMVACREQAHRLTSSGALIQSYPASGFGASFFYGMNLDPDDTTFWTGDYSSGIVYRINLHTGAFVSGFTANAGPVVGLAVFGEPTSGACGLQFTDVPTSNTFYGYTRCLACRGIIGGYADGTFRPYANISRGQIAKVVSNAAGFNEPPDPQIFEDVPPSNAFYAFINRMSRRGHMSGYECGSRPGMPCLPGNRPYFDWAADATRGQLSKVVANGAGYADPPGATRFQDVPSFHTFYLWVQRLANRGIIGGYACGGPGEPCVFPENLPYFRPNVSVTRGQASKIVADAFFPGCQP